MTAGAAVLGRASAAMRCGELAGCPLMKVAAKNYFGRRQVGNGENRSNEY